MGTAFKITPYNHLRKWGAMESWALGTAPDLWTIGGAGATIASDTSTYKFGSTSAVLTRSGADAMLSYSFHSELGISYWQGRTVSAGAWCYTTSDTKCRFRINDGVGTTYSDWHQNAAGSWLRLEATRQIDPDATKAQIQLMVQTSDVSANWDGIVVSEGEFTEVVLGTNIDVSRWRSSSRIDLDSYKIPEHKGIYIPKYSLNKKSVSLTGQVVGSDAESTRTHFDELLQNIIAWRKDEKMDLYLHDDRVSEVFLDRYDWDYPGVMTMIKYRLDFTAEDPTTRYLQMLRKKKTLTATYSDFTVPYLGDAPSKPIISVLADTVDIPANITINNYTTGQKFSYTGTVPNGYTLEIDCFEGTVESSGVNSIDNFTGEFLELVHGTNYMGITATNCSCYVDYFDRWYI